MKNMLSIGEMAKLNGISIQRLRYYDNIGLLSPDCTDPDTKYRYYHIEQSEQLTMIQQLQYIGMSLAEIKQLFIDNNPYDFEKLINQCEKKLEEQEERIKRKKKTIERYRLAESIKKTRKEQGISTISKDQHYILSLEATEENLLSISYEKEQLYYKSMMDMVRNNKLSNVHLMFLGFHIQNRGGRTLYSLYVRLSEPIEVPGCELIPSGDFLSLYCTKEELSIRIEELKEYNKTTESFEVFIERLPLTEMNIRHNLYLLKFRIS